MKSEITKAQLHAKSSMTAFGWTESVYNQTKEILMSNEQHDHNPAGAGANSHSAGAPGHEDLYDRFIERASEHFAAGQEKSREAMEKAMDTAR